MNIQIKPFTFEGKTLRTIVQENGEPLFNANDVCAQLEYSNARDAISNHVDGDDVAKRDPVDTLVTTRGQQRLQKQLERQEAMYM